ncbi:MAG: class IV adenylate cyclase [Tissierellia bacterium]|nr:class IV adenylate cyclase [Tissierellia bacterium]
MEREMEVKILNEDVTELKKKVLALGAQEEGVEEQINIRLQNIQNPVDDALGYLRLRIAEKKGKTKYEFTFKAKEKTTESKNNMEYTTLVEDPQALLEILKFMGIEEVSRGTKHREKYSLDGSTFDFDTWDEETYPHPYMEIEVTEEGKLEQLLTALDIAPENVSTKSIGDLSKEYWESEK